MTSEAIIQLLLCVCGALLGLVVAILTWLGKKIVTQGETAQNSIATLTASLYTNSQETKKLHTQIGVLLRAFTAFDRWIYGEAQHGSFKTPPPEFTNDVLIKPDTQ